LRSPRRPGRAAQPRRRAGQPRRLRGPAREGRRLRGATQVTSASPGMLTTTQKDALLALARDTAKRAAAAERGAVPGPAPDDGLATPGAAFVTVRVGGELRGCIGTFEAREPLWDTVHEMATAAATRDPRFAPLATHDLPALTVDVSVLAPARRVLDAAE